MLKRVCHWNQITIVTIYNAKRGKDWIVQTDAKDWGTIIAVHSWKEIAIDVLLSAHRHHLFPSVIFSQSILESGGVVLVWLCNTTICLE